MRHPWTLATVAQATRGVLVGEPGDEIGAIATDSRKISPGSLFVALRGEQFDGHDFAARALAAGAVAVLVERGLHVAPRIEVDDTSLALRDLGAARRSEIVVPVVAVTGSTGKTSTKDLLAAALPNSAASEKSYNNEVGVPLTVLGAPDDMSYLILEVGSRGRGHIAWLMPAVKPDVAIITNLGVVHLETFGSEEALTEAKWELVEGLTSSGTAVLPVDESRLHRSHAGATLTFGETPSADVYISDLAVDELGRARFAIHTPVGSETVRLAVAGAHQAQNAAAAVAAGLALGVPLATLLPGLERAAGSAWRMEIHRGRFTVVNDAYNANPDSVRAALRTVAALPGRHVAVLGKMAELGPVEAEEHRRMGAEAARLGYETVVTVGEDPGYADGGANVVAAADIDEALDRLRSIVTDGDVVLVKASRALGLEVLAQRLIEEAGA
jgi:UDP-N-acetylmuramoyl-tripeptide--D-alanyl-D-alanine ligase